MSCENKLTNLVFKNKEKNTKNQGTKNNGHKGKAMKHKDHVKKTQLVLSLLHPKLLDAP